jgi:hypothetical protein
MSLDTIRTARVLFIAVAVTSVTPTIVRAQSLASRIAAVSDGLVQFRFAARPGLCGNGRGMIGTAGRWYVRATITSAEASWQRACEPGPVRVVISNHGGEVERVRVSIGGSEPSADVTDLGLVSARTASDYLLATARGTTSSHVGEDAVLAAVLADSVTIWPALLALARDESRPRGTREGATFWLSRMAAAAADGTTLFASPDAADDSDDEDVRTHAVFALSQQPHGQGIPPLLRIARTTDDRRVRSAALFWLGQSRDPRALALFEELLHRSERGPAK